MKKIILLIILSALSMSALMAQESTNSPDKEIRPALLVIDIQNEFVNWMDKEDIETRYEYINYAIALFRKHDLPVIRVYHTTPGQGPEEGTKAFEFVDAIAIKDSDPMVIKNHGNAFNSTDLEQILKEKNVNTLFLTGLSGTGCVLASYFGAKDLGYDAHMIKNTIISPDVQHTQVIEESQGALSVKALLMLLKYGL